MTGPRHRSDRHEDSCSLACPAVATSLRETCTTYAGRRSRWPHVVTLTSSDEAFALDREAADAIAGVLAKRARRLGLPVPGFLP